MKILYAIQGTGNGHIARAFDIIPELKKHGEVDLLISGYQCDIKLPWEIKYRLRGLSFIFGKKGGVDFSSTLLKLKPIQLIKEIFAIPVEQYDLILNDFEPVTAWACKLKGIDSIGISHQSAVLHKNAPSPEKRDRLGRLILKHYAPVKKTYGFHFKKLSKHIFTPVIRRDVREAQITNKGHYTVYLPAYDDQTIIKALSRFSHIKWQVFSKHNKKPLTHQNIEIKPVDKQGFTESMVSAQGVLCTAGFETPAEALFLGKKLCVMPMKGQYEQQCNAALLKEMGVPVLNDLLMDKDQISNWLTKNESLKVNYPDITAQIIEDIIYKSMGETIAFPVYSLSNYSI